MTVQDIDSGLEQPSVDDGARDVPLNGTLVATRVADVLALFLNDVGALGVSEISRELGISKAVAHRIVRSLVSRDLLVANHRAQYSLGPATAALGLRAARESALWRAAAAPMRSLVDSVGVTVTLSARVGLRRVYLRQIQHQRTREATFEIGHAMPLLPGATGLAIAAFLPDALQERLLARPSSPKTPITATDPTSLRTRLAEVRAEGLARSLGERNGKSVAMAAPIFGYEADVIGALTVAGSPSQFERDALWQRAAGPLREQAAAISRRVLQLDALT